MSREAKDPTPQGSKQRIPDTIEELSKKKSWGEKRRRQFFRQFPRLFKR